jgi:hypothetical protein
MITISVFLSLTLILVTSTIIIRKKINLLTLIFVFLTNEYLFTSFISTIVDDAKLWTISEQTRHFFMFRVAEVVVFPLLLIWYLEFQKRIRKYVNKFFFSVLWILLLVLIEGILIKLDIIKYEKWETWCSILVWSFFLLVSSLLQRFFSSILFKEGIRK